MGVWTRCPVSHLCEFLLYLTNLGGVHSSLFMNTPEKTFDFCFFHSWFWNNSWKNEERKEKKIPYLHVCYIKRKSQMGTLVIWDLRKYIHLVCTFLPKSGFQGQNCLLTFAAQCPGQDAPPSSFTHLQTQEGAQDQNPSHHEPAADSDGHCHSACGDAEVRDRVTCLACDLRWLPETPAATFQRGNWLKPYSSYKNN